MVEKRGKFAALADLHRSEPEAIEPPASKGEAEAVPSASAITAVEEGRGRRAAGKRSNPDFKLYSHYLRRKTQRAAVARLQAEDNGRDLSDILQELLENWLKA